jgi:hypothetical protein
MAMMVPMRREHVLAARSDEPAAPWISTIESAAPAAADPEALSVLAFAARLCPTRIGERIPAGTRRRYGQGCTALQHRECRVVSRGYFPSATMFCFASHADRALRQVHDGREWLPPEQELLVMRFQ